MSGGRVMGRLEKGTLANASAEWLGKGVQVRGGKSEKKPILSSLNVLKTKAKSWFNHQYFHLRGKETLYHHSTLTQKKTTLNSIEALPSKLLWSQQLALYGKLSKREMNNCRKALSLQS